MSTFAMAAAAALPKPGRARPDAQALLAVPAVEARVGVDRDRLAAFVHAVHGTLRTEASAGYLHTLGFLPGMELMTSPGFGLPVMGMVHVHNSFVQYRPVVVGDELDLRVEVTAVEPHKRGTTVDITVTACHRGRAEPAFRDTSTYLARGRFLSGGPDPEDTAVGESARRTLPFDPAVTPQALWRLDTSVTRDYARVSDDINPIHLSTPAAKAFGFPARIAHGMYSASRALAAIDPHVSYSIWEVSFAGPIVLPATVTLAYSNAEAPVGALREDGPVDDDAEFRGISRQKTVFQVFDAKRGKPHVLGSVTFPQD